MLRVKVGKMVARFDSTDVQQAVSWAAVSSAGYLA